MSSFPKMPLSRAQKIADRFMSYLEPFVEHMSIAGSIRRECEFVGDVEVVCVPKDEFSMGKAFPLNYPGLKVNGSRLKRFIYPESQIQIELYICKTEEFGRILGIRTGSSAFTHIQLAIRWGRLGWAGTEDGLRRKSECIHKRGVWKIKPEYKNCATLPPPFYTEEDFFNLYFYTGTPGIANFPQENPNLQKRTVSKIASVRANGCKRDTTQSLGYTCSIKSQNEQRCKIEDLDFKKFLEKIGKAFEGIEIATPVETTKPTTPAEETVETPTETTEEAGTQPTPTAPSTPTPSTPLTETLTPQTPSPAPSPTAETAPSPTEEELARNILSRLASFTKGPAFLPATGTALIGIALLTILVVGLVYFSQRLRRRKSKKISVSSDDTNNRTPPLPPQNPNVPLG